MKTLLIILLGISFLFGAVDINNANKKELMSLKGIGDKKANAILNYTKENCFKDINALVDVKGIGSKTLEKNRKNLKAGKCKTNGYK